MASFLVLYHTADRSTGEVNYISKDETSRWLSEVSNCVLEVGQQVAQGTRVTDHSTQSMSIGDAFNDYVILKAKDKDEALELSRTAPTIYEGGSAEVYQISRDD